MTTYTPLTPNAIPHDIFRAYDIRGKAERDLTSNTAYSIGLSLGTLLQKDGHHRAILGRDGRLSSPRIHEALQAGLLATGLDLIDVGRVPTPMVYFATFHLGVSAGIMITGSHNPKDDNGIKLSLHDPALIQPLIAAIPDHIAQQTWLQGKGHCSSYDIKPDYIAKIAAKPLQHPFHVVLDCGNGIAGEIAPDLFKALGCQITPLFCEVDGDFPNHHPDPTVAANLKDCQNAVASQQADIGFIFDGDADRVGVVTHTGTIVWADQLMMLFAQAMLKSHPGAPIVFDIKCSDHLAQCIEQHQGKPVLWYTGHTKIKAKMKAIDAPLAGEMSGHIFFNDEHWYGFDDGLYGAFRLLEILDQSDHTLQDLVDALPTSHATPEILLPTADADKQPIINKLKTVPELASGTINDLDGLRISFEHGWGLIRPSNTTANLTLRFEAKDAQSLDLIMKRFHGAMLEVGAIDADYQWPEH